MSATGLADPLLKKEAGVFNRPHKYILLLHAVCSLVIASCNLSSSKSLSRLPTSNKSPGQSGAPAVDNTAVRVDSLAIPFSENLIAQGLSEGQAAILSNSARSEMSAISTGAIVIGETTSMLLQSEPPTIAELMGAMARGGIKAIAVPEVRATSLDEKIEIGRIVTRAAFSTIASNGESSASDESKVSSVNEIVAEMAKTLPEAGVSDDDIHDATAAISGEAIANVARAGFTSSAVEAVLPKIAESTARGVASASYAVDRVPEVLEESTKAMVARLKEANVTSTQVTLLTSKLSDAVISGISTSSRGSSVIADAAGAVASGAIASLADHGLSKEVIRITTGDITTSVVKAAVGRTNDTSKIATIQDQTVAKVGVRLQNTGFSEAETDLLKDDLSSRAAQAAAEAKTTNLTNIVVVRKNPQIKWLAMKKGNGSWARVDLNSASACDAIACRVPVSAANSYALAYVCETSINSNPLAPDATDPYFFQRNNFDPMIPSKRVNLGLVYDKIGDTIGGQSPNCNDLYVPSRDPSASAPIFSGAAVLKLVSVKVTVTDADAESSVCQIGMTPFVCGAQTTLSLPQGKGVRVLIGSGLGSDSYIAPSGIPYLAIPKKVKLVTLDIEQGRSYSLAMDGALQPSLVTLTMDGLTKDRAVILSTIASIGSTAKSFSVNLGLSSQRFLPDGVTVEKVTYNLPTAANLIGATVSLTGSTVMQANVTSGQSSTTAWRSQAFTKKILPSDSAAPLGVKMLPDLSGEKFTLTNGDGTALPLTWLSDLDVSDSVMRRFNLHQLNPDAALLYTIYAPSAGVAANTNLVIPSELRTLDGWDSSWELEKRLSSFWSTAMSSPIGTDGTTYSMSSAQMLGIDASDRTRDNVVCQGTQPTGESVSLGVGMVNQKLTQNGWAPTSYWHFTPNVSPAACEFTCQTNYQWNGKACVLSSGSFSVRIAQSLPSTVDDKNSQLTHRGGKVCVLNSTLTSAASSACYDSTNNTWVRDGTFIDPRTSLSTTSSALSSGIPVYLQEVGTILMSLSTDGTGIRFAKYDSSSGRWVQSSGVLPGTVSGSTLQYARLYSSVHLYAVYAWSKSDGSPWRLHVAKSSDNGVSWTQLATREVRPNSLSTSWDFANKNLYIRYLGDIPAGNLISGNRYLISSVGTTDFTKLGASSNSVGITFTATGSGVGTGVAEGVDTVATTAGDFIAGHKYVINSLGSTDFRLIGAARNGIDVVFTATGAGSGSGTASSIFGPTPRLLNVADGSTPTKVYDSVTDAGAVVVWNGFLYGIDSTGHLATHSYNSGSGAWESTTKLENIVDSIAVPTVLLDVQVVDTSSKLDIFYYDIASRNWKHSRLAYGGTSAVPHDEIVAFAQNYSNSSSKKPFVNSIVISGVTTRYFNFYDGVWKRVPFNVDKVQSATKTLSSINAKIIPHPSTAFLNAAGLYNDGVKLFRIAATSGSPADLQSSERSTGSSSWSDAAPWSVIGFSAVKAFGDFANLGSSNIVGLDCNENGKYQVSVSKVSGARSGVTLETADSCGGSPDQSRIVTNSSASSGNPNILSIAIVGTTAESKLMARRLIYNDSTPSINQTSSKPSVELFALPGPATMRQVLYAKDRIHILMCDPLGNSRLLTWLNPNLGSSDSPQITLFLPAAAAGCFASSITADSSGNIALKMLDEPRGSFVFDKSTWTAATTMTTSVALGAYDKLLGGSVFVHGSNYCKVVGMGAAGNMALVSMCLAKPTSAVPNPTIQRRLLDDVDFGGELHSRSVAVFDGKIHVIYPSLYLPGTFRYVVVPD